MSPQAAFQEIQCILRAHANPDGAVGMRAYMRDQFPFLGIKTPLRRELMKGIVALSFAPEVAVQLAQALWKLPEREYHYVAIDLLGKHKKVLQLAHLPSLLQLAQDQAWWDSVDGLAAVIGDVLLLQRKKHPQAQELMDHALHHDNMWVKRIAMTHQLGWRLQTDSQRLFSYASTLASKEDFFIRKAIGWALRDYAKWSAVEVRAYVQINSTQLSALSVREALKNL